jgi:cobalt/nickel transport protein
VKQSHTGTKANLTIFYFLKQLENKMKKIIMLLALVMALALSASASAHFQTIYTPESALEKGETINLKLIFTHPFEAGHTMDIGKDEKGNIHPPKAFGVMHKEKKKNLLKKLKPIEFTSLTNRGKAFEASYKLRGMGDYVFYFDPAPYYEGSEDIYIEHVTKMIVNVAGAPTDWDAKVGLPVEIIPLDKPYALWTGNVFRGVVTCHGKPVPDIEIEVEYMNHDIIGNAFAKKARVEAPQDSFVTLTIKADSNGVFTFGIPRAGWWGFAALGAGGDLKHKGKELSLDAVIWVQARDMK